jgi:DNA polymerase-3 subunit gamma/tau
MSYVALYRKFRPPVFDDVKGQDHVVTTLKNQIKSDRVGHAYLFCGTRGTGKTSVAKIFAKAVNCEHPVDGSPCGECDTCKAIASGNSMNVIEIDAASNNGVDNIREIIDEVSYSPTQGKYKVYIIDEVHMLSSGAFNALLKTLEEPPAYVIFILATTEVQKIPITILSRCQRYDFHRITIDTIEDRLKEVTQREQISAEEKALRYIARAADGSMRDSLSLLDQCIAFNYGEELTYDRVLNVLGAVDTEVFGKLFSCLYGQDAAGAINLLADIVIQGRELTQFVNDFVWYLRNLMLVRTSDQMEDVVDISAERLAALRQQAQETDMDTIMRYIRVFSELSSQLRFGAQKRILIEMTLIKLCKPQMEQNEDSLQDRIRILEEHDAQAEKIISQIQNGQISVAPATGGTPSGDGSAAAQKMALDRAVPEEIQYIVKNWSRFLNKIPAPAKVYLQMTPPPRLSLSNDNGLQIVFNDEIRAETAKHELQEIEDTLAQELHKQVPVEIRYLAASEHFEENYIDLQAINFDIVTEDETAAPQYADTAKEPVKESVKNETPETGTVQDEVTPAQPAAATPEQIPVTQQEQPSAEMTQAPAAESVPEESPETPVQQSEEDQRSQEAMMYEDALARQAAAESDDNAFEEQDEPDEPEEFQD